MNTDDVVKSTNALRTVDFVIPLFNEQEGLAQFHHLLRETPLPANFQPRYIYVNDGSTDGTQTVLEQLAASDSRVTVIDLSRNFGHQAALSAGLEAATADVVISLDGDGQHPPSLIPDMLRLYAGGCDIVQTRRIDRSGTTGVLKRVTSRLFYRLISAIGDVEIAEGSSDFRLLSRRALDALLRLPEYHRFIRGMAVWIGFATATLPYETGPRIGGGSKYSFRKMLKLAGDGLFSFSLMPLRIGLLLGTVFIFMAGLEVLYVALLWFTDRRDRLVPGWSSLVLILTVSSALNMILVGILGIYVGMIFREVKHRPVYLLRSRIH